MRRALGVFMVVWVVGWLVLVGGLYYSLHNASDLTRSETEQLSQNRRLIRGIGEYMLCVDDGRAPESCRLILEEVFGE